MANGYYVMNELMSDLIKFDTYCEAEANAVRRAERTGDRFFILEPIAEVSRQSPPVVVTPLFRR